MIFDNSRLDPELIAEKEIYGNFNMYNLEKFQLIKSMSNDT
jgi:hypothetical protein